MLCIPTGMIACDIPACRVYLLGGAQATGQPNDTVVYYVAGDVQSRSMTNRQGLGATAYLTLLPGHFWSDSLFLPGAALLSCPQHLQHAAANITLCMLHDKDFDGPVGRLLCMLKL